jgi:rhodanese-related sulfurtransferase
MNTGTVTDVTAATLKTWLHDGQEIALFDVREAGQFGEGHLFYAVPLPFSRFEIDLTRLAPRKSVRLVLHDGGDDDIAQRAARRAQSLGYGNVHVLKNGASGWQRAGLPLFKGVNVVSKAFGELAEHAFETPYMTAEELQAHLAQGDDVVVLDGRPFDEYQKMSIPGATCCPNGELALRIGAIVPDAKTTIVINCAGRTRSIIGAQTLRNVGIPNPVYALRNGTMGWHLAGYKLNHGGRIRYPDIIDPARREALKQEAGRIAKRWHVRSIDAAEATEWLVDQAHTTYLLDIRTVEEFAAGHALGAIHAPGGQLVQATDQWIGVRNGRVILLDDSVIRATATAIWLQAMGWSVAVLRGGPESWRQLPDKTAAVALELPPLPIVTAGRIADAIVLDLRPSNVYRAGHIANARWTIRPRLAQIVATLPESGPLVLAAEQPGIAEAFASDLPAGLRAHTSLLAGDIADWRAAGLTIVATPDEPNDSESIDLLFFVHDRHAGNLAAARNYLAWETGLVAQLDELEKDGFNLPSTKHRA